MQQGMRKPMHWPRTGISLEHPSEKRVLIKATAWQRRQSRWLGDGKEVLVLVQPVDLQGNRGLFPSRPVPKHLLPGSQQHTRRCSPPLHRQLAPLQPFQPLPHRTVRKRRRQIALNRSSEPLGSDNTLEDIAWVFSHVTPWCK